MRIRHPKPQDGATLWRLVRDADTLELNSAYAYLLMATHFADTCLLAEDGGEPVGLVVGYRPPVRPEAVFVWQVAVSTQARGQGLGKRLLFELAERTARKGISHMEATVTPGNDASRALFQGVARQLGTECRIEPFLTEDLFPEPHEAEDLLRIGPFEETTA